jgi:thiaminase
VLAHAGDRVADIEQRWANIIGSERFDAACYALQQLLDELAPDQSRR